jgi:hypothetical protein
VTPTISNPIKIPVPKGQSDPNANPQDRQRRRRTRRRAPSEASSQSSQSGDSPTTPPTQSSPEEGASPIDVATSPLLSYFLAHASPTKSAVKFSFKNRRKTVSGTAPELDDDEVDSAELPHVLHHARRLSSSWANNGTIGVQQKGPITESQQERNNSLMRRLSIGGGMARPAIPNYPTQPIPSHPGFSPTSPVEARSASPRTPRRAATMHQTPKHRPPSPTAERMLKGHFDGF